MGAFGRPGLYDQMVQTMQLDMARFETEKQRIADMLQLDRDKFSWQKEDASNRWDQYLKEYGNERTDSVIKRADQIAADQQARSDSERLVNLGTDDAGRWLPAWMVAALKGTGGAGRAAAPSGGNEGGANYPQTMAPTPSSPIVTQGGGSGSVYSPNTNYGGLTTQPTLADYLKQGL